MYEKSIEILSILQLSQKLFQNLPWISQKQIKIRFYWIYSILSSRTCSHAILWPSKFPYIAFKFILSNITSPCKIHQGSRKNPSQHAPSRTFAKFDPNLSKFSKFQNFDIFPKCALTFSNCSQIFIKIQLTHDLWHQFKVGCLEVFALAHSSLTNTHNYINFSHSFVHDKLFLTYLNLKILKNKKIIHEKPKILTFYIYWKIALSHGIWLLLINYHSSLELTLILPA
jgi:hypothetical protein